MPKGVGYYVMYDSYALDLKGAKQGVSSSGPDFSTGTSGKGGESAEYTSAPVRRLSHTVQRSATSGGKEQIGKHNYPTYEGPSGAPGGSPRQAALAKARATSSPKADKPR